jgi:hypothetical protein
LLNYICSKLKEDNKAPWFFNIQSAKSYELKNFWRVEKNKLNLERIRYLLKRPFSESNVGQASIERLIFKTGDIKNMLSVFPLVINCCNFLPKLKKIDVNFNITISEVSQII